MVQGLAVLFMLFFHLFNGTTEHAKQLFQELYGSSVLQHVAQAHNPVPFFVLISGYALFTLQQRGEDKHRFSRLGRLYVRYWYVLVPFLLLDYWLGVYRCDLSLKSLLLNTAGIVTSYNAVCWFILPYCILAVSAKWLFGRFFKQHTLTALLIGYGIYAVMAYLTRYPFFQTNALQCFYILFPFLLGGALARYHVVEIVSDKMKHYPPRYHISCWFCGWCCAIL